MSESVPPSIPESRQMTRDDRLDEETEHLISNICWGDRGSVPLLRSRIRELQQEARNIGYANGQASVLHDDRVFINGDGGGFQ